MKLTPDTTEPTLPYESGGFRIVEELGRGGMGIVYRAEEASSGRVVALKVLARELVVSTEAFQRFQREARVAAAISDRNCVFVFGAHDLDGAPAIAMELCTGETLQERLQRGDPIPIADAVRWTMQILEGLAAAHEAGILHRDVKPSNCFLTESGDVKVGDFGLSKVLETDIGLTRSGAFLGSPLYASPEQARGRPLDLRSDLYSVGATLYALLTGRGPYTGTSVGEVLARILSEEPDSMRTLRSDIPRGLEKVVLKAMNRKPEERYKDHEAFSRALEPYRHAEIEPAGPIRRFVAWLVDSILGAAASTTLMALGSSFGMGLTQLDPERPYLLRHWWIQLALSSPAILYPALTEGLWGATLGKWLIGVRVVAVDNLQASLGRAFVRALLFYGTAPLLLMMLHVTRLGAGQRPGSAIQLIASFLPAAITLAMISTARKRNGWQGLHGKLSGTRAVMRPSPFERHRTARVLDEARPDVSSEVPTTVGRIAVEGVLCVTPNGRLLVGRDQDLDRSVWIHEAGSMEAPVGDVRRSTGRPGRLRWLAEVSLDGLRFEIFESPGGAGLLEHVARRGTPDWPLARRWLLELSDELAHEDEPGTRYAVEQLWIDRAWGLRVLDTPAGADARATFAPLELLSDAAHMLVPADGHGRPQIPSDLPIHAEPALRRLVGLDAPFADLAGAREALQEWKAKPASPPPRARIAQLALSTAVPLFFVITGLFASKMMSVVMNDVGEGLIAAIELAREKQRAANAEEPKPSSEKEFDGERTADADAEPSPRRPFSEEDRQARRVVIRAALETSWAPVLDQQQDFVREILSDVRASLPPPTPEELAQARDFIAGQPGGARVQAFLRSFPWFAAGGILCASSLGWGMLSVITTLIAGCGLSFRIAGLRLRTGKGEQASRLRYAWRSAFAWGPTGLLFASAFVAFLVAATPTLAFALVGLGALVFLVGIGYAVLPRGRSLQDRLARTRIVPM